MDYNTSTVNEFPGEKEWHHKRDFNLPLEGEIEVLRGMRWQERKQHIALTNANNRTGMCEKVLVGNEKHSGLAKFIDWIFF